MILRTSTEISLKNPLYEVSFFDSSPCVLRFFLLLSRQKRPLLIFVLGCDGKGDFSPYSYDWLSSSSRVDFARHVN